MSEEQQDERPTTRQDATDMNTEDGHSGTPASPAELPRRVVTNYPFAPADRARLIDTLGAERFIQVPGRDALRAALHEHPDAEVVITVFPPEDLLTLAPDLRWLQLASAGVEHAMRAGVVRAEGPVVTNASGVHGVPISEFVLSAMLVWARKWPELLALQREHDWPARPAKAQLEGTELFEHTLGVVGLGAIGSAVARLGHALGMRVLATKRTVTSGERTETVDELLPSERLDDLLAQSDYVVLCTPLTRETAHLIDARRLAKMRPNAVLINIARGQLVNEADLVHALQAGTIAGAALDVFEIEPLPESSPLWSMPNVLVSPHISGSTDRYSDRLASLVLENLRRYRAGAELLNVVDPARGY